MKTGTFMFKDGREIAIQGVSQIEMRDAGARVEPRLRAEGVPLDPPRYSVEDVSGAKIWYMHNETTLDADGDPKQTAENHRAWWAYEAGRARLEREVADAVVRAIIVGGVVDLPDMPKGESYWRRRTLMGLYSPVDPAERYGVWIVSQWITQAADLENLLVAIRELSFEGVDWERVAQVRETFPGALQGEADTAGAGSEGAVGDR